MRPTLLIVDDHAGFRASARRLLEAEGFAVVGEADGALAALPAVARLSPDVVLVDIALPDGDGFDVCADIVREHSAAVVLTSSRTIPGCRTGCGAAGRWASSPRATCPGRRSVR